VLLFSCAISGAHFLLFINKVNVFLSFSWNIDYITNYTNSKAFKFSKFYYIFKFSRHNDVRREHNVVTTTIVGPSTSDLQYRSSRSSQSATRSNQKSPRRGQSLKKFEKINPTIFPHFICIYVRSGCRPRSSS
jgi:hypothetical protein